MFCPLFMACPLFGMSAIGRFHCTNIPRKEGIKAVKQMLQNQNQILVSNLLNSFETYFDTE